MRKFLMEWGPVVVAGLAAAYFDLSGWQLFQVLAFVWLATDAFEIKATVKTLFELEKLRERGEIA